MQRALLLDRNYMALSLISWKKATRLLVKEKAEPVTLDNPIAKIVTSNSTFIVPSILRLTIDIPWRSHNRRMKFNRKFVYARDLYECLYCGHKVGKNLTIDHVLPKSRGGKTDYLNCVTCCKNCNNLKSNLTPEEAGMNLLKKPHKPSFLMFYGETISNIPEEWKKYIIGA